MTSIRLHAPSTRRLLVATLIAMACAAVLLITVVLPAEYGLDPTGIGRRLGLDSLYGAASPTTAEAMAVSVSTPANMPSTQNDALEAGKARKVFGETPGQSFATDAVRRYAVAPREERMQVVLPPGKGAEVKAIMQTGDTFVFHWRASADVAVDMHGDRVNAGQDEYTTYWIEGTQRQASGQFTAPFEGKHGWYWQNRSSDEISVEVTLIGQYEELIRPGH